MMDDEYNDGFDRDTYLEQRARRNFVTPMPAPLARREPQMIDAVPHWLQTAQPVDVAAVWGSQEATKETTSAVDRAKGLQLRLWPFLALYAGAGLVVGLGVWLVAGTLPGAALLAVLTFAGAGIFTYRRMNLDDYDHSGAGVERLRITEASDLARAQLDHEYRLRELALNAYLKRLDGDNGR